MGTTKQSLDCPSLLTSLLHKSMLRQMKAPRLRSQKCSELPEMQEREQVFSHMGDPMRRWMMLHATGKERSPSLSPVSPSGWQEGLLSLLYIQ